MSFGSSVSASRPILAGAIENNSASLVFTTGGGTKFEYLCTVMELIGGRLKIEGGISEGSARFTGCVTLLNGTLSKACQPRNGIELGVITTNQLKGKLVFHEGVGVVRVEPVSGTVLASLSFGSKCSISEEESITGVASFQDTAANTEQVVHLWTQGPLTAVIARSQPATINAAASVSLSGPHIGLKWSGWPE
jgi:hypothetical protein